MQTMMNHRFEFYIPKEIFSTKEQGKKKITCLHPKPNCLRPFLSVTAVEGVFKEPLIHSCNMLTVGRVCENTRSLKGQEYCTQSGGAGRLEMQSGFLEGPSQSKI